MAGAPCPLPHALHANPLVMDELGGAVLRRSDGLHQREELCLDARTGRCDHHLLGGPQRQSSALRVEGQGRRYPAQNRRRQTRARRWPCPMQLYFRYITLAGERRRTRETLLWNLAGQPGYRVIHQLHLSEVAVAMVVFDARNKTDPL